MNFLFVSRDGKKAKFFCELMRVACFLYFDCHLSSTALIETSSPTLSKKIRILGKVALGNLLSCAETKWEILSLACSGSQSEHGINFKLPTDTVSNIIKAEID